MPPPVTLRVSPACTPGGRAIRTCTAFEVPSSEASSTPSRLASLRISIWGAAGAMESIVTESAAEAALVLPAVSVALAVRMCWPSARGGVVKDQWPEPSAVAVPSDSETIGRDVKSFARIGVSKDAVECPSRPYEALVTPSSRGAISAFARDFLKSTSRPSILRRRLRMTLTASGF